MTADSWSAKPVDWTSVSINLLDATFLLLCVVISLGHDGGTRENDSANSRQKSGTTCSRIFGVLVRKQVLNGQKEVSG